VFIVKALRDYQILDEQDIPICVCDTNFNILFVNEHMKNNNFDIKCDSSLYDYSASNNELLQQASYTVKEGRAFHSDCFSFNLINNRIHVVPIKTKSKKVERVICYLEYSNGVLDYHRNRQSSVYETLQAPAVRILNFLAPVAQKLTQLEEYDDLDHLNKIAKNSYQILRKSSEITTYHKLVNNTVDLNLTYHILNNYLDNILKSLQLLLNDDYRLTYELCDEKIFSLFDEEYLSIALFHVISNSCIFSPKGSNIHITLKPNNDFAVITITDEGIGIPQDKMDFIFNAFYSRMDSNKSLELESVGLGLPITKNIIDAFNGKLFISSEEFSGTKVMIALPIAPESDIPLTVKSDNNRYFTNRLSNMYIYFCNICDISLF
jgi:hypothetical protein